jgi:hypothetical protein
MEVDADLHASSSVVGSVANDSLAGLNTAQLIASRDDVLQIAIIGVLVMFHLFYSRDASIGKVVGTGSGS